MENKYHSEASASFNLEEDDGDSIVSSLTSDNESNATCASSLTSIYESNAETLPTPIEDDSILNSDDESYSESRPSIHTVPSYLRIGAVENGRVYATYGINKYALPMDEIEQDRLDINHEKYLQLYSGRLYLCPLEDNPRNILDIGCGTGMWCIDIADNFPSAAVVGIDIAVIQPQAVPPNCEFQIDDAEQEWTFQQEFDLIHCRDMLAGVRDWKAFLLQCYNNVRPGGWIEISSVHFTAKCDDGTMPPNAALTEVTSAFHKICELIGADADYPVKLKELFVEAGFEASEVIYKIPSSQWAKGPLMKSVGCYEAANLTIGAYSFLNRGWPKLNRTMKELAPLVDRLKTEVTSNKMHSYMPYYCVYGRKPLSGSEC